MTFYSFMKKQGYKCLTLKRVTRGDYSPRDSEWNYSDIPHLNYVHRKVDGHCFHSDSERIINLFMQQLGPFSIPVANYIEHTDKNQHRYWMNIVGMVVGVATTHNSTKGGKSETLTEYKFYYRNFVEKIFAFFIKQATKKNYSVLMSEDVPMRNQRGVLRNLGIKFSSDKKNKIGFEETADLTIKNVDAKGYFKSKKELSFDLNHKLGTYPIDEWFITIASFENKISILGNICQHEGANLNYDYTSEEQTCLAACPWHGKRIAPLITLNKTRTKIYKFNYLNQSFEAKVSKNHLFLKPI